MTRVKEQKETTRDMHREIHSTSGKHTSLPANSNLSRVAWSVIPLLVLAVVLGHSDSTAEEVPVLGSSVMSLIEKDDGDQLTRLVELGMSPNSKVYESGKLSSPVTLLEYACLFEKVSSIKALVGGGADLRSRTEFGKLPIEILIQKDRNDLATILAVRGHPLTDEGTFEHIVCEYLLRIHASSSNIDHRSRAIKINGKQPSQILQLFIDSLFPIADDTPSDPVPIGEWRFSLSFNNPFGKDTVNFQETTGDGPMTGGVVSTEYRLRHGYWIPAEFKSIER